MNEIAKKRAVGGGVLVLALLAGTMGRGEEWRFGSDGGLSPWVELCTSGNTYEIVDGELVMRPAQGAPEFAYLRNEERRFSGDVSMRVQGRVAGPGRLWFAAYNRQCGDSYTVGFNSVDGNVSLNVYKDGAFQGGPRQPIGIVPDRYINLQLDVRCARLEVRAWWEGEDIPPEAHVSLDDMTHRDGWIGIGFSSDGPVSPDEPEELSYAVYRSVSICGGPDCTTADAGERYQSDGFFEDPVPVNPGVGGRVGLATTSADELVLYFHRWEIDPRDNPEIFFMRRASRDDDFVGPAQPLDGLNTADEDWIGQGGLTRDGKKVYFTSNRLGSLNSLDIWVAEFNEPGEPEGGFQNIKHLEQGVNTAGWESNPSISCDELRLYYRSGGSFYVATRENKAEDFGSRVLLSSRLGAPRVLQPAISPCELTLFWGDERSGDRDIWMATRERILDDDGRPVPFDHPQRLGPPINTGSHEIGGSFTADWPASGSAYYFTRGNTSILLRATWHPDCNGNQVDDLEEIAAGDVEDVNRNGVPDECERDVDSDFLRGDCNADGTVDISDAVCILNWLFLGDGAPSCVAVTNTNGDAEADLSDAVYLLGHLFLGGPPPAEPFPACGPMPDGEELACATQPVSCQ